MAHSAFPDALFTGTSTSSLLDVKARLLQLQLELDGYRHEDEQWSSQLVQQVRSDCDRHAEEAALSAMSEAEREALRNFERDANARIDKVEEAVKLLAAADKAHTDPSPKSIAESAQSVQKAEERLTEAVTELSHIRTPTTAAAGPTPAKSDDGSTTGGRGTTPHDTHSELSPLPATGQTRSLLDVIAQLQKMHAASPAAASKKPKPQQEERKMTVAQKVATSRDSIVRGVSERFWPIAVIDLLFALASAAACTLAVGLTHYRGQEEEFADDSSVFPLVVLGISLTEVVTAVFIVSRFFVAQRDGKWEIVDDIEGIRRRYRRGWLAYDLVYTVPIELIFAGWWWPGYRWVALRHFLRVPRMLSLGESSHPLLERRRWFQFLTAIVVFVIVFITLAAVFWALEPHFTFEESVYWATATFTAVGYGDVTASSPGGMLLSCAAMFVGVMALSTIVALVQSMFQSTTPLQEVVETAKGTTYEMLETFRIPWDLQKEVIATMPMALDRDRELQFREYMSSLPDFLQKQVDAYVVARSLRTIPLFSTLDSDELSDLSNVIEKYEAAQGTLIVQQGATDREMFVILYGQADVLIQPPVEEGVFEPPPPVVLATLKAGAFFGEGSLLRGGARAATVRATTICDLRRLSVDAFEAFMVANPAAVAKIATQLQAVDAERQQQDRTVALSPPTSDLGASGSHHIRGESMRTAAFAFNDSSANAFAGA